MTDSNFSVQCYSGALVTGERVVVIHQTLDGRVLVSPPDRLDTYLVPQCALQEVRPAGHRPCDMEWPQDGYGHRG